MKYIGIFLVRLYQKFISPLKRQPTCRFTPTCSSYAIEAFREWGLIVGLCLAVWRVLRCNPFCAGGYDPVPKRKRRRKAADTGDGDKNATANEKETKSKNQDTQ